MKKNKNNTGFTLIEVMIVVAIIGLLAAVAYPSYMGYIVRGNRTDAMEQLNEVMSQQQRYVLRQRTFTTALTDLGYPTNTIRSENGFYTISAAACGAGIVRCVQLTATPVAGSTQQNDGTLTINSRGEKSFAGADGWYHR